MHPQATFYMYAMYMQCALYAIPVCCYLIYLVPTYQCESVHLLEPSISQSSRAGRWRPRYHSWRHCIIASGFLENSFKMKQIHIKISFVFLYLMSAYPNYCNQHWHVTWPIFQSIVQRKKSIFSQRRLLLLSASGQRMLATHDSWAITTVPHKAWRYVSAPDVYAKCSSISKLHKLAPTSSCHVQIHQRMHCIRWRVSTARKLERWNSITHFTWDSLRTVPYLPAGAYAQHDSLAWVSFSGGAYQRGSARPPTNCRASCLTSGLTALLRCLALAPSVHNNVCVCDLFQSFKA